MKGIFTKVWAGLKELWWGGGGGGEWLASRELGPPLVLKVHDGEWFQN